MLTQAPQDGIFEVWRWLKVDSAQGAQRGDGLPQRGHQAGARRTEMRVVRDLRALAGVELAVEERGGA